MLSSLLKATSKPLLAVELSSSTFQPPQTSDASRTMTLSSGVQVGDMILAMTANRSSTPPVTSAGYTSIVAATLNTGAGRSINLQYKFATSSSESISWTGAYGSLLCLKNAKTIGKFRTESGGTVSSTVDITHLNSTDNSGNGFIMAGNYYNEWETVSSTYTILPSTCLYIENNTLSNVPGVIAEAAGAVAGSFAVEILP